MWLVQLTLSQTVSLAIHGHFYSFGQFCGSFLGSFTGGFIGHLKFSLYGSLEANLKEFLQVISWCFMSSFVGPLEVIL